jgi:hypothetical protein
MLRTRLFLTCDGDGCASRFPRPGTDNARTVDASIMSAMALRTNAALVADWLRVKGHDYCPDCVFLYRLREQKPKGGK